MRHLLTSFFVILICLVQFGCSGNKRSEESWRRELSVLTNRMKELEKKKAEAESFIESADIHQVTRSQEEKARQLSNLNKYMAEIDLRIDSTRTLIGKYNDSIGYLSE